MTWREINMLVDTGTNEWDGDEGEECDNFEPDYDKDNDDINPVETDIKLNDCGRQTGRIMIIFRLFKSIKHRFRK